MFFVAAIICVFRGLFLFSAMTEKLNQKLPASERWNLIGFWTFSRRLRFRRMYSYHFPADPLQRQYNRTQVLAGIFMIAFAIIFFSLRRL
jgi:hypothetical protein